MKRPITFKLKVLILVFGLGLGMQETVSAQQIEVNISYQDFYDGLSPFGLWINYPGYGHVWHPSVDGNFQPYFTNGHWEYCSEGWIWVSLYSWGWAPFHYGRWIYDDLYGWLWVPGYEWAPAWVIWGEIDNYYAWAPLMPSVNVIIWYGSWRPPAPIYWNVVDRQYIYDRDISNRGRSNLEEGFIGRIKTNTNYGNTRYHDQFYAKGPEVVEVEKITNRKIDPIQLRDLKNAAPKIRKENELQIYRPRITTPEPRTYRDIEEISPNPLRNKTDRFKLDRLQQNRNVEKLPVRKAPINTLRDRTKKVKSRN